MNISRITPIFAVSRVTFQEILRDKVLLNIVLLTGLLLLIALAASQLSFITPERVVIDFGFTALNVSGAMIAILHGSAMIHKEFERRTIFVALARPISYLQFLFGKFCGLAAVLVLNSAVIAVAVLVMYTYFGGKANSTVYLGLGLLTLQSVFLAALTLLFASFSTASEAVIIMIGLYLIGNNVTEIETLALKLDSVIGKGILQFFVLILPSLENFNLGFTITYGLPIGARFIVTSVAYAVLTIAGCLLISSYLVQRRE